MSFYYLDENSPKAKQPKGLKIKLKNHQLTCLAAMLELEKQGSIIIDQPSVESCLYQAVRHCMTDLEEITSSTFVLETNSAILADKVGAGKTFSLISLILSNSVPPVHNRFIIGTDYYSVKMISVKESEKVNLVVVPHNLINQWEEFMKYSSLNYLKLNNEADFNVFFDTEYVLKPEPNHADRLRLYRVCRNKKIVEKQLKKLLGKNTKNGGSKTIKTTFTMVYEKKQLNDKKVKKILDTKQVFILNINRYRFFKRIFRSTKWARVIIDEMNTTALPTNFSEFGNFNWFVTATPTSIFYKSCRRYVNKIFGYNTLLLEYFTVKNKDEYVDASMVLPKPHVFMVSTLLHRIVSAIQDLIPMDVLQLINAGNMKEAIIKLNCEVDTEENIIKVLTEKIKDDLHNLKQELAYVQQLRVADQGAHNERIAKIQREINSCQTKLDTVYERINSIRDECCFICAEPFDMPTILNCCKNVFCLKCLLGALKSGGNKCPYCRSQLKSNKEYHVIGKCTKTIDSEKKPPVKEFKDMDKADVLEKILMYIAKKDASPRILIFSDYSQTFEKIVKNIAKAKLKYEMLSGTPAHIVNVINQFNNGTINVLMLDSQHYGSGLNLQAADYLILYHRMMPELETQVIGRAHRFGRNKSLKIIYLVNDSESHTSRLVSKPEFLHNEKDLSKIFDVGDERNNEFEENVEYSDGSLEKEDEEKKTKKSKKTEKKVKKDKEEDLEDLDLPQIKKKKKKKYVEI